MFRPYLAIFRHLFTFRNRRTALDHKSKYFSVMAFTPKYIFLRTSDIHWTSGNTNTKGAQTWTPQEENSAGT
jgi:hypothetical protein